MSGGTQSRVKVVLRDPLNKTDQVDYNIIVDDTNIAQKWYGVLTSTLRESRHLEKNFCFLGFPDSPRNLDYICQELNRAKNQINSFFNPDEYIIKDIWEPDTLRNGLDPNQDTMNVLHNHFEILQGTVDKLSNYYIRADYQTKFAIRQLNILCHEAESLMLSQRKKAEDPYWIRPSQLTTFLTVERHRFPDECRRTFDKSRYDRKFGHVYLHWTQIGKTLFEVFNDENGADIDKVVCDAITHLKYYSGEFDVEWGRTIDYYGNYPWYKDRLDEFASWLWRNGFDHNDPQYNYGHHQVGYVENLGTPEDTWDMLSKHMDIYRIEAGGEGLTFDYTWADTFYPQQQLARLKRGYDYSSSRG